MKRWFLENRFLLGIIGLVILAGLFPEPGARGGWLRSEWTRGVAVFVIFLIQGVSLPLEELKGGLRQWRLHGYVLGCNYLGFPVLTLLVLAILGDWVAADIRFGFVYLAVLPTTITAAVFFTSATGGQVGVAVFATAMSNIISVVFVPLGVSWLLVSDVSASFPLAAMFLRLAKLIVLPMALGQVLRLGIRPMLPRLKPYFKPTTTASIFFIMYCTFCDSAKAAAWERLGWGGLVVVVGLSIGLLAMVSSLVWLSSRWFAPSVPARVTLFFCASQKSMATGVPMAASLFALEASSAGIPDLSLIVLPLMCYHLLQLTLAARLVPRFQSFLQREQKSASGS